jgi:hypothetical protein
LINWGPEALNMLGATSLASRRERERKRRREGRIELLVKSIENLTSMQI